MFQLPKHTMANNVAGGEKEADIVQWMA